MKKTLAVFCILLSGCASDPTARRDFADRLAVLAQQVAAADRQRVANAPRHVVCTPSGPFNQRTVVCY